MAGQSKVYIPALMKMPWFPICISICHSDPPAKTMNQLIRPTLLIDLQLSWTKADGKGVQSQAIWISIFELIYFHPSQRRRDVDM
uniref:Uncharacterized protein n=1 Tax=Arundo donax TaxID=35708 RepID=A0A0A9AVC3_ARUDO